MLPCKPANSLQDTKPCITTMAAEQLCRTADCAVDITEEVIDDQRVNN